MILRDVELDQNSHREFFVAQHIKFLRNYAENKDNNYEQLMVEYLKMSGIYWTIMALKLVNETIDDG